MLKPSEADDVPAIVALMNRAYRASGPSAGWSTETAYISGDRTTVDLLRADLLAKPGASLLKWVEPSSDDISGCVWLEPIGDDSWYLGSLTADPDRQNRGFGRTLLEAAEDWIRGQGGTHIDITVINVRTTLIAWYVRRGYRPTGTVEPFPYGDDRFGTPLRDDLNFVVLGKDLAPRAAAR